MNGRVFATVRLSLRFKASSRLLAVCCLILPAACAHRAPALRGPNTALLSGRTTAGESQAEAANTMLAKAARMTVDHGFRYFEFVGAGGSPATIQPGSDVAIRIFRQGEIDPQAQGVWNAERILTGTQVEIVSSPIFPVTPAGAHPAVATDRQTASCTIYGCVWKNTNGP